jgi:hypothetical protein
MIWDIVSETGRSVTFYLRQFYVPLQYCVTIISLEYSMDNTMNVFL